MTQDNARVQFAHCFSAPQGHLRSVTILKSVTSDVLTSVFINLWYVTKLNVWNYSLLEMLGESND